MPKKRKLTARTLQADFWTALPIDECYARLKMFQQYNTTLEHYHESPSTSRQSSGKRTRGRGCSASNRIRLDPAPGPSSGRTGGYAEQSQHFSTQCDP